MADFTAVAQPPLERVVDAIRDHTSPELILLFGSRATGGARDDSDYDLMIVLRDGSDLERGRRDAYDALHAIGASADVLVRSVSDYSRRQADPGFLDWLICRKGRPHSSKKRGRSKRREIGAGYSANVGAKSW